MSARTLSPERQAEIKLYADRQYDDFQERGYTDNEIIVEAEANIRYYAELLAQAEALLDLAAGTATSRPDPSCRACQLSAPNACHNHRSES